MIHLISDVYPPKGHDIIGYDIHDNPYYVFRCACPRDNCHEWRCSISGSMIMVDLVKWKYYLN